MFPLPELPPPASLAALGLTAFTAGLARGFSGFGGALIFVPIASAILGPRLAAPVLMLLDNVLTVPLIPAALRIADRREVALLSLGALAGAPAGGWLLQHLDSTLLRWSMCALAAAMLALIASGWRYHGRTTPPLSVGVGGMSGLFSGVAQMGGPPVVAYWLGGGTAAVRMRANIVAFFAVSGFISGIVYLLGGLLTWEVVFLAALSAPAYGLGLWGGARLFGFASEATFRHCCLALIGLSALLGLPLWDGLR